MSTWRRLAALTALASAAMGSGVVAQASAASFTPAPGTYTVDTTTLTLTGPGTNITGADKSGIAVFSFDSVDIGAGVTINVHGTRPLALGATGTFALAGTIDGSGTSATPTTAGANPGGPGGGAGGADGGQAGSGPGGGQHGATSQDGGGGGGFGGAGATGGTDGGAGGAGGSAYGDLNVALQGGSGGAGGSLAGNAVGGGGGGGAIELLGSSLTISPSGVVRVNGGDGSSGGKGASGGGSGGAIILHADTIDVTGKLSANGGAGGSGGAFGDGGGGGGGRICYQYRTLTGAGTASVSGGTSGTAGPHGHGELSPQATGAAGVVTEVQAASATTSAATSISTTGAKLHGIVNANGSATTYQFEYGTTTAYGTTVPVPGAIAGSGSSNVTVSQVVSGLKPGTTYHYRIVATNQSGFTTAGADMTFTTPVHGGPAQGTLVVTGSGAIHVGATTAILLGSVIPGGANATYFFEYGTTKHFGNTTTIKSVGSGTHKVTVRALIKGLRPGTTYYFRLVVRRGGRTVRSHVGSFTTLAKIVVTGLSKSHTTSGSLRVRIHVISGGRIRFVIVMLGHHKIMATHGTSLTVRVPLAGLRPGTHFLRIRTRGTTGATTRTLRFRIRAAAPSFTG